MWFFFFLSELHCTQEKERTKIFSRQNQVSVASWPLSSSNEKHRKISLPFSRRLWDVFAIVFAITTLTFRQLSSSQIIFLCRYKCVSHWPAMFSIWPLSWFFFSPGREVDFAAKVLTSRESLFCSFHIVANFMHPSQGVTGVLASHWCHTNVTSEWLFFGESHS